MKRRTKVIAGGALAVAVIAGGAGAAVARSAGENETPITGEALDKASLTAIDHTGGGRVTDTEVGDEDAYYEVEVTLDNGSQVDVHLDRDFNVISQVADDDTNAQDKNGS